LLSFFRVNARYQTISLAVFFLLLRLPFFLGGAPLLIPELNWMLVGEQMGRGFMLYRDVWDNVSPFSGLTYWLIDSLFGRAQWVYQLAAMGVSLVQILYFNYVIYSRDVFPERTFLPGALYALFLNISFDMGTLSPMLLANTFLLFAFGSIVKMLVRREVTTQVFRAGDLHRDRYLVLPAGVALHDLGFPGIVVLYGFYFPSPPARAVRIDIPAADGRVVFLS
jgi:hypothetical protein